MKSEAKTTIKIAENIASIISSRDIADILENAISKHKSKKLDLDFSNVEFISRSAAHALLSMKEDLQRRVIKKKEISFINTNEEVEKMFRIIAANRALPKPKPSFKAERINITKIL